MINYVLLILFFSWICMIYFLLYIKDQSINQWIPQSIKQSINQKLYEALLDNYKS